MNHTRNNIHVHSSPAVQGADDRAKRTESLAQRLRAADHAGSDAQKEHLKALDPARKLSEGLQQAQADLKEFKNQNETRKAKEDKLEKLCRSAAPFLQDLEKNLEGKPQFLRALPNKTVKSLMATAYHYSLLPEYEGLMSEENNRRLAQRGIIASSAQQLQVKVDTLQSKILAKNDEIKRLISETALFEQQLQAKINDFQSKIATQNDEITGLKRKLMFTEIEKSSLQDSLGEKDQDIGSKSNTISRQIEELNALGNRFNKYKKDASDAADLSAAKMADLERDISEANKDVCSKQRIISTLEKKLGEATGTATRLKELEADLTAGSMEQIRLGEEIQKEKQARKELHQQLKDVTRAKQQLEDELHQLKGEVGQLQERVQQQKRKMEELQSHGKITDASCANLKRQLEDAKNDVHAKSARLYTQAQQLNGVLDSLLRHLVAVSGVSSDQSDWVKFAEAMMRPNTITLLDVEMEAWSLQEPWGGGVQKGQPLTGHSVAQASKELYICIRKQCWTSATVWLACQFCEALRRDASVEYSTIEVLFREWKTATDGLEGQEWTVVIQSIWYALGHAACVLLERLPHEDEAIRRDWSDVRNMFASRIKSPFLRERLLGMVSDDDDTCWLQMDNKVIVVEEESTSKKWILIVDLHSKKVRVTTPDCWTLSMEGSFVVTVSSSIGEEAKAVSYPLQEDEGRLRWFVENIL